ncbi:MAG: sulfatase [Fimbriimonadaceae bacterium]|nr:sulfatase [Fimbriimonadaceae bacterium]
MRILYLDIDSLRPDHLGCYGYHRQTSPNIDAVASDAVRYEHCYTPDAPCLPSRTAMFSGRFGIHTGVVNHGGSAADLWLEGPSRGFRSSFANTGWMNCLRQAGYYTTMVSPFAERHSAHWFNSGFREIYNSGKGGLETADEVQPYAFDWLQRHARRDDWFLHVNFWDPHTPYRTPAGFGNPFADDPAPAWLTEEIRQAHWDGYGPHGAQEPADVVPGNGQWPRQPDQIDSLDAFRRWIDGYDCGVRYADDHVGRLLNVLADQGVLDDTVVIVTADHGENLGEKNVYGDHQTADNITSHIPMIVKWPGVAPRVDAGLLYNVDLAATVVELAGGTVPAVWDGVSFAAGFRAGQPQGRPSVVASQCAWACQRAVRWGDLLLIRSYHDGWKMFQDVELYDVAADPHLTADLAGARPADVNAGLALLEQWTAAQMVKSRYATDPLWTTVREGGPLHTRWSPRMAGYLQRLRDTGRGHHADYLQRKHAPRG